MSLAQAYGYMGDYSQVESLLAASAGNPAGHAATAGMRCWQLNELGILYTAVGQYEQAFVHLEQAMECSRIIESEIGAAYILCNLGQAQRDAGRLDEAQHTLQEGLLLAQQHGDVSLEAIYLSDAALTSLRAGDWLAAAEQATRSLALFEQLEQPLSSTAVYATLAAAQLGLGEFGAAEAAARAALAILDECGGEGPDFPHRDYWLCAQTLAALGDVTGRSARRKAGGCAALAACRAYLRPHPAPLLPDASGGTRRDHRRSNGMNRFGWLSIITA